MRPAVIPHIMIMPDTGTASRFAGSATSDTSSKTSASNGATATCAPMVALNNERNTSGPRRRSWRAGAITISPRVAATESWNASDHARSGSHNNSAPTAMGRVRAAPAGRPRAVARTARETIAKARVTEGSNRVTKPKKARTATVARTCSTGWRIRFSSGPATSKTNTTF